MRLYFGVFAQLFDEFCTVVGEFVGVCFCVLKTYVALNIPAALKAAAVNGAGTRGATAAEGGQVDNK